MIYPEVAHLRCDLPLVGRRTLAQNSFPLVVLTEHGDFLLHLVDFLRHGGYFSAAVVWGGCWVCGPAREGGVKPRHAARSGECDGELSDAESVGGGVLEQ